MGKLIVGPWRATGIVETKCCTNMAEWWEWMNDGLMDYDKLLDEQAKQAKAQREDDSA